MMEKKWMPIPLIALLFLMGCAGETETTDSIDPYAQMEELKNNGIGPSSEDEMLTEDHSELGFHIDVPERMNAISDLNESASAQYAYVEEAINQDGDTLVFEHYLVVMEETLEEMASYPDTTMQHASVMEYRDMVMPALEKGLASFEVLLKDEEPQVMNNMEMVSNEMRGEFELEDGSRIAVFYKLGVFKSKKAFYQVLTWCVEDQKMEFLPDMEAIIASFHEH